MRWLIFSGLMQNYFPIFWGFKFSTNLMWRISLMLPRKFQASLVQGFAKGTALGEIGLDSSSFYSSTGSIITCWAVANALSFSTESVMRFSPLMFVGRTPQKFFTSCKFKNSSSASLQSGMNLTSWSSIALMLLKMKVVKTVQLKISFSSSIFFEAQLNNELS